MAATVRTWHGEVLGTTDRATGLLPHRVDSRGRSGVSASASTVTLAAARAVGDATLAEDLSREAELLGLPISWGGERRYALGALPVGDAFLAWARTRPAAGPLPADPDAQPGRSWWPLFGLPFLLPLVVLIAIGRRGRRG